MDARHPITGKPIRIMRTETHLYRDKKTLVWLRDQEPTRRYGRWETIVTNEADLRKWTKILNGPPLLYASLTEDDDEVKELLDNGTLENMHLIFLRKSTLIAYGQKRLQDKGYQNIVCVEEISQMYPHALLKYSEETTQISDIILAIGGLFRFQRVYGFNEKELEHVHSYAELLETTWKMEVGDATNVPEELWLIQQYFIPSKAKREHEIAKCLKNNLACSYIDKIILLNEEIYDIPANPKIRQVVLGHRLKYWDVMEYIRKDIPDNVIVAFSNSDIYFDESWRQVWSTNLRDKFLSILRYEVTDDNEEPQLFGPRPDSQDTWVVFSTSLKSRQLKRDDFDFEFGRAGCDNAINMSMLRSRFVVCNPAYSLKTFHLHTSGIRTYNPLDCIEKPMYLYLIPTGLHDMQPVSDLKPYEKPWVASKSFSRQMHGDKKELRTLCNQLAHEGTFMYDPDEENTWYPSNKEKETIYRFKNSNVTSTGLVYDYSKIYLGKLDILKEQWAKFELNQLTPALSIESALAILCSDEVANSKTMFITKYLSKVFCLRDAGYKGEFWVPKDPAFKDLLTCFGWEEETIPIMPRNENIQAFASEVIMMSPVNTYITSEEIAGLRMHLKGYVPDPMEKRAVIMQDDHFLDVKDVTSIETILENLGYMTTVVYSNTSLARAAQLMSGASLCITSLTKKVSMKDMYWLLPKGCAIIEGQYELEPMGEGVHYAGASGLEYFYYSMPRGIKEQLRGILLEKVYKCMGMMRPENKIKEMELPVVFMPIILEGMHAHVGDSFREMIEVWEERGYVRVKRGDECVFCHIGETLLYDRPTFKWLASQNNRVWKKILVGNPEPMENMVAWSFWPRRPRLVEELVKEEYVKTARLVFYGKIENQQQRGMRKMHDWSIACDDFSLVEGDEPYKYSQEEVLRRMAKSRFGLCLAGYGNKCHREIECMAFGTVPICSPEVDMDNYANPPREGIHYFRAKNPSEAKELSEQTDNGKWQVMSDACKQWWLKNASAEGLWKLTSALIDCV
jgi:hypothetical protein